MVILLSTIISLCCLFLFFYLKKENRRELKAIKKLELSQERNLQATSVHPQIDLMLCIGCSSCVVACPETHGDDSPLAMVNGQSALVSPLKCIGHGKCEKVCPTGALKVNLGKLANDPTMPKIDENCESKEKGIYIIGELSGVALIKNALLEGQKVIEIISKKIKNLTHSKYKIESDTLDKSYDLIIIGSGPAGISASLKAQELNISYITLEQNKYGGTIAHYPKQKLILTEPVWLPLYGKFRKKTILKEELLSIWYDIRKKFQLNIIEKEKVNSIDKIENSFHIKTENTNYKTPFVILALGRRGIPKKLGVEGEELTKVMYSLLDAASYKNKKIIVSGGGDSAIETALALMEENEVCLSYRQNSFVRLKQLNLEKIELAQKQNKVKIYFNSNIIKINESSVELKQSEENISLSNDYVFVLIGGELPTKLLSSAGVINI